MPPSPASPLRPAAGRLTGRSLTAPAFLRAGACGHIFHLDCIGRWLRTRSVCPLCNREWELTKTEQIHGYALID